MNHSRGFTVIEVIVVLAFVATACVLFLTQKASVDATVRDNDRKTSINALYYSLEEVYYEKNGYYPQVIESQTLRSVDPELFYDPADELINSPSSTLYYNPIDCSLEGKCKRYTLRAALEREAEYIKDSRRS